MNILGNLGKMKNIKNTMKFLGRHQGRMRTLKVSLKLLVEWLNRLLVLGKNKREKPRAKERRRRFNLLRSLLPRGRGLKKTTPPCIEMGR